MNRLPRLLFIAAMLAALAGCGNKGPLVLPPPPELPIDPASVPESDAAVDEDAPVEGQELERPELGGQEAEGQEVEGDAVPADEADVPADPVTPPADDPSGATPDEEGNG